MTNATEIVPADAHRLREITGRIAELKGSAALVLYELGVLLVEVDARSLWRAGDYTSFSNYLDRALDVSESTARRAMTVAQHFNAGMVARYGIDKLSAGLRYLALTHAVERPGDLVAAKLRLRGERGRFETVSFHEASSRQVREAIRVLETTRSRGLPEETQARAERLGRALAELGGGEVRVRRRRDGGFALSLRDIPMEQLAALADALRDL